VAALALGACGGSVADGPGEVASALRWAPPSNATFYWELANAPPDTSKNVGAVDMDGFDNSAATVSALHAAGKKAVCYVDVGTWEDWRSDASQFPAALKGSDNGWPGEKWLDIRSSGTNYAQLQSIMSSRFSMCQTKGFDAVEPDNMDGYQNSTGFSISYNDQLTYNRWVASTVHGLNMAVFQKNDLGQIPDLVSDFDGILDEECNVFDECALLAPYSAAHKPVWNSEYVEDGESTGSFCSQDVAAGIVGALFSVDLDGSVFQPCSNDIGIHN
jgi:hypothetical protein